MIDKNGYRANVGIVIVNQTNQAFWGRRIGQTSWQFPQGGIADGEDKEAAMFRELNEEVGLSAKHVIILGHTSKWLYYDVPTRYCRSNGNYRGQKQIWYLLRLIGQEHNINLKHHKNQEFDAWRWIDYWEAVEEVVYFKHDVYQNALTELVKYLD